MNHFALCPTYMAPFTPTRVHTVYTTDLNTRQHWIITWILSVARFLPPWSIPWEGVTLTCFGRRGTCGWCQSCRSSTAGCSPPSRWPAPPPSCQFLGSPCSHHGIGSAEITKKRIHQNFFLLYKLFLIMSLDFHLVDVKPGVSVGQHIFH